MKSLAATVVFFGFLSLASHCSLTSTDSSRALSQNNGAEQERKSDIGTNGGKELHQQFLAMEKELDRATRKLGLERLSDSVNTRDEIRIWVGFGIILPRCLILIRTPAISQAIFLTPRVRGGRADLDRNGDVIYQKQILNAPKSGWYNLGNFLHDQGIGSPLRLAQKRPYTLDPDEAFIAIEAGSGSTYSMVFFPTANEERDAKTALDTCRRLESEFDINMGCGDPILGQ
jgi:hypothetical protein